MEKSLSIVICLHDDLAVTYNTRRCGRKTIRWVRVKSMSIRHLRPLAIQHPSHPWSVSNLRQTASRPWTWTSKQLYSICSSPSDPSAQTNPRHRPAPQSVAVPNSKTSSHWFFFFNKLINVYADNYKADHSNIRLNCWWDKYWNPNRSPLWRDWNRLRPEERRRMW